VAALAPHESHEVPSDFKKWPGLQAETVDEVKEEAAAELAKVPE